MVLKFFSPFINIFNLIPVMLETFLEKPIPPPLCGQIFSLYRGIPAGKKDQLGREIEI
ncbi:MAG: hypothetical protein JRF20_01230 [Deltaproteobacteria bacterium]|nr:hypothetical protein [Deltaproteobacteria bacterium]MBW1932924.1 hypothetical protein [Deltaproteobacteria bacterium]MBW1938384.1 hypothetical protein [Deltaproteobacteria bacterium]MBW1964519.1 hypothetical protein [Deltaproteobacteria bacterium]MBW2349805.1 hypothetical protein [Deltaproteobacteria bacterium]